MACQMHFGAIHSKKNCKSVSFTHCTKGTWNIIFTFFRNRDSVHVLKNPNTEKFGKAREALPPLASDKICPWFSE